MSFDLPGFRVEDRETQRFLDQLLAGLNQLNELRILQGQLVEGIDLVSGDNDVEHKLGRALVGWIITRKSAAVDIYDKQDDNNAPGQNLILNASGAVTVDLWVF